MLTLNCVPKQVDTQIQRWLANALLAALRHGPIFERPGTPWRSSAKAPNAPVNLPYSPVFEDLRTCQRRIDRLHRKADQGELDRPQQGKLYAALSARTELIQTARDAIWKEPAWPYVAGLYLIRVPALRIQSEDGQTQVEAFTAVRALDVSDDAPHWPALSAVLARQPRGVHTTPAPAFRPGPAGPHTVLGREKNMPGGVAEWLLETVAALHLSELDFAGGDYLGTGEEKRYAGEAITRYGKELACA